jgi:hypothetical protein
MNNIYKVNIFKNFPRQIIRRYYPLRKVESGMVAMIKLKLRLLICYQLFPRAEMLLLILTFPVLRLNTYISPLVEPKAKYFLSVDILILLSQ